MIGETDATIQAQLCQFDGLFEKEATCLPNAHVTMTVNGKGRAIVVGSAICTGPQHFFGDDVVTTDQP